MKDHIRFLESSKPFHPIHAANSGCVQGTAALERASTQSVKGRSLVKFILSYRTPDSMLGNDTDFKIYDSRGILFVWANSCHCFVQIHELKSEMSEKIISLRNTKLDIIEQITNLTKELVLIQIKLDPSQHLPIPVVPSMYPDEMPEKKFQYDQEKLLEFRGENLPSKKRTKQYEQAIETEKIPGNSNATSDSTNHQIEGSAVKLVVYETAEQSKLEEEIKMIEEKTNLYMQTEILRKVCWKR